MISKAPLRSLLTAAALAATLVACGDEPEYDGPPQDTNFRRDLLTGVELAAGSTLGTELRTPITRGVWKLTSNHGSSEAPVRDGGGFPMGTILIGNGVDGESNRSIRVTVPPGAEPSRVDVRFMANDGTSLRLRPVLLTPEPAPGEWQTFEPEEGARTASFALPETDGASSLVLEIQGDCTRPHFLQMILIEEIQPSSTARRIRVGNGRDRDVRAAVGLASGAQVVAPTGVPGPAVFSMSLASLENAPSVVRVALRAGDEVVAEKTVSATEDWKQVELLAPETGDPIQVELAVDGGPGAWITEERIDAAGATPRTVFLVTSDTHRGDHIGAFDSSGRVITPALDALADRGVVFTDCFAPTNVTNPSHMALMTGMPLRDTRVTNNVTALSRSANTLAEQFQAAGYRTFGAVSVMHLKPEMSNLDQGFDRYDSPLEGKRDGEEAVEQLLEWVDDADGMPLFVWLHVYDAHAPYNPPQRFVTPHYDSSKDPRDESASLDIPIRVLAPWIHKRKITDRDYIDALYAGGVDYVDSLLGRMFEIERIRDGICAVTADHGESLGEDGVWWDHSRLNQSTVHIPLLMSWPGGEPGRSDFPVEQIDVGRTLLDLAEVESEFPGENLVRAYEGSASVEPRFSLAAHGWSAAVEADGWMLTLQIRSYPQPFSTRQWMHGETELYNLREDPTASKNVLDDHMEVATELRAALTSWLNAGPAQGLGADAVITEEARASLEALGYAGGKEGQNEGAFWSPDPNSEWNQRFER